jgi:DNA-binding response OmpR family regulator
MKQQNYSVLIVEDEKPLSHALELKLQKEGHSPTIASNGEECLQFLSKHDVDVILLDIMMPLMDGFQVLEKIKKLAHKPYIIVLSNLSQANDEQRAMELGANMYFVKSETPLAKIVAEINNLR